MGESGGRHAGARGLHVLVGRAQGRRSLPAALLLHGHQGGRKLSIDYGWWSMVNVLITGLLIVVEVGCKWNMWIVDGWSVIVCGCVYIIC